MPTDTINNTETINEAGSLIIDYLFITTTSGVVYDIKNFCAETVLYEDIFSNVMTGHCLMLDSAALISKIPFQGTEYLTVGFRTPNFVETISRSFYITGVKERTFVSNDREITYVLNFISTEGAIDNVTALSRKYSGTTDDVVKSIFTEYLSTPRIFGTPNGPSPLFFSSLRHASTVSFVSPKWSPFKAINWVAARSYTTTSSAPNFLFYESNKAFYYTSIEALIDQQKKNNLIFAEYSYSPSASTIQDRTHRGNFTYTKPELAKQYSIVTELKPMTSMDILRAQDYGYLSSKLITHDILLKQYKEYNFDYYVEHPKFQHLEGGGNSQPFPHSVIRGPDSYISVRTKQYKLFNDSNEPHHELWSLRRNSLLYEASNIKHHLTVPGRTDIEVGKMINFLYPKGIDKEEGVDEDSVLDPYMSGLYLITAIKHSFAINKHEMTLEIMKDSFPTPLR